MIYIYIHTYIYNIALCLSLQLILRISIRQPSFASVNLTPGKLGPMAGKEGAAALLKAFTTEKGRGDYHVGIISQADGYMNLIKLYTDMAIWWEYSITDLYDGNMMDQI